jgi:hypothetical protein
MPEGLEGGSPLPFDQHQAAASRVHKQEHFCLLCRVWYAHVVRLKVKPAGHNLARPKHAALPLAGWCGKAFAPHSLPLCGSELLGFSILGERGEGSRSGAWPTG